MKKQSINKKQITVMLLGMVALAIGLRLSQFPNIAYLPLVAHQAVACPTCDRGVAWLDGGCSRAFHTNLLVANYFYSSDSYSCTQDSRAIVIIRPDSSGNARFSDVIRYLPTSYTGYILVGNEFDRPDQDNLPPTGAAFFTLLVRSTWPQAILVGPNMSHDLGNPWLKQFFSVLPPDILDIYSFHLYGSSATNVKSRVDLFCQDILCDKPIWITEMGYQRHRPAPTNTMRRWALEAREDGRVDKVFAFTNWHDVDDRWSLLNGDLTPSTTGRGWIEAAYLPYP